MMTIFVSPTFGSITLATDGFATRMTPSSAGIEPATPTSWIKIGAPPDKQNGITTTGKPTGSPGFNCNVEAPTHTDLIRGLFMKGRGCRATMRADRAAPAKCGPTITDLGLAKKPACPDELLRAKPDAGTAATPSATAAKPTRMA